MLLHQGPGPALRSAPRHVPRGVGDFIPSCADKVRGGDEWRDNCGSCDKRADCRWCAVYSYLETGRYSAPVPYLCAVADEAREFKADGRPTIAAISKSPASPCAWKAIWISTRSSSRRIRAFRRGRARATTM